MECKPIQQPRTHRLKTIEPYFSDVWDGFKTFELRENDRNYQAGDLLILKLFEPDKLIKRRKEITATVNYVLPGGKYGLSPKYCILGIVVTARVDNGTNLDQ